MWPIEYMVDDLELRRTFASVRHICASRATRARNKALEETRQKLRASALLMSNDCKEGLQMLLAPKPRALTLPMGPCHPNIKRFDRADINQRFIKNGFASTWGIERWGTDGLVAFVDKDQNNQTYVISTPTQVTEASAYWMTREIKLALETPADTINVTTWAQCLVFPDPTSDKYTFHLGANLALPRISVHWPEFVRERQDFRRAISNSDEALVGDIASLIASFEENPIFTHMINSLDKTRVQTIF